MGVHLGIIHLYGFFSAWENHPFLGTPLMENPHVDSQQEMLCRANAPHEVWTWWGNVTWVSPSGTCGEASNTKMGGTLQSGKPCLRNRQRGEDHSDFTKLRYVHSFNMVETHHFSIVIFGIKTMGILGQVFLRIGIPIPFFLIRTIGEKRKRERVCILYI